MATSNGCEPTLASPQIEKMSIEKSCSFSQRSVNTRSVCDLLVRWPESPASARQPLRAPLSDWRTRDTSTIQSGELSKARSKRWSCGRSTGHRQRGDPSSATSASPSCLPESPPTTLPHLHRSTSTISFGTSTARHSTSSVTARSSPFASSALSTSKGCRGWPPEPSRSRTFGGQHGLAGSLLARRTLPSTSPGTCDADPYRGQGHPAV